MHFRVTAAVLLVLTVLAGAQMGLAGELGPESVHLSVLVSTTCPFDRQQAQATYLGADSLVYGYVVAEDRENSHAPLADLKFAIEIQGTPGVTVGPVHAEGGWRDGDSILPPLPTPEGDCESTCLLASFPIRLGGPSGNWARIQIVAAQDGTACAPTLKRRDGNEATLQYTTGASINTDLPPTTVYPVWRLRPGQGGRPATSIAVEHWLREQAWTDFPVPTFADSVAKVLYRISPEGATHPTHRFEGQSRVRIWGHRPEYEDIAFFRSQSRGSSHSAVRVDSRRDMVDSLTLSDGMLPGPRDRGGLVLGTGSRGGGPAKLVRSDGRILTLNISAKNALLSPDVLFVLGWPVESERRGWDSNLILGAVTFYQIDYEGRIILQNPLGVVGSSSAAQFALDGSVATVICEGTAGGGWSKLVRYSSAGDVVAVELPSDASFRVADRLDDTILLVDRSRPRLEIRDFATLERVRTIWAKSSGPLGSRAVILDGHLLSDDRVCAEVFSTRANAPSRAIVYDGSGEARWRLADYPSECAVGNPSRYLAHPSLTVRSRAQAVGVDVPDAGVDLYILP